MADLDAERIAAQRELAATREKQLEVAKRTEALEAQAAHCKSAHCKRAAQPCACKKARPAKT